MSMLTPEDQRLVDRTRTALADPEKAAQFGRACFEAYVKEVADGRRALLSQSASDLGGYAMSAVLCNLFSEVDPQ